MSLELDDILAESAMAPVGRSLEGLEPLVWSRVETLRGERLTAQVRLGAVAVALATGLTAGGVGAAAAPTPPGEMAIFTVDAGLSPLVRLEASR